MRRIMLALAMVLPLMVWAAPSVEASSFNLNCPYTRSLRDDPIVYPNQPGASHLHDFFGNETTNAYSTTASLVGGPTSCANEKDPSAYWAPTAFINGARVYPDNLKAYYIRTISGTLEPFPTGLRMLAGNGAATTAQSTKVVYYGCGTDTATPKVNYPPDCTAGGHLLIHIIFPECGTGALDSADHRSHMAYAVNGACPTGYPKHFPQLAMRVAWDIEDARTLKFSCLASSPTCVNKKAPYYSEHADFINAWDPDELARLVGTL